MIQTREILSATAVATGTAVSTKKAGGVFQAAVSGTGQVAATVVIEGSLYGGDWITIATIGLAGLTSATDGFIHNAPWCFYRARCTAISGTNALVTTNMGGEV